MNKKFERILLLITLSGVLLNSCYGSGFSPWGNDASLIVQWTINGGEANEDTCINAEADKVRMSINSVQKPWYDSRLEWSCWQGEWNSLDSCFSEGEYWIQLELLDYNRNLITKTRWEKKTFEKGENSLKMDFYIER